MATFCGISNNGVPMCISAMTASTDALRLKSKGRYRMAVLRQVKLCEHRKKRVSKRYTNLRLLYTT